MLLKQQWVTLQWWKKFRLLIKMWIPILANVCILFSSGCSSIGKPSSSKWWCSRSGKAVKKSSFLCGPFLSNRNYFFDSRSCISWCFISTIVLRKKPKRKLSLGRRHLHFLYLLLNWKAKKSAFLNNISILSRNCTSCVFWKDSSTEGDLLV